MNRPKIRDRFKYYRMENESLKEALKINDIKLKTNNAHRIRDITDLDDRVDELENEVRFYKNNEDKGD